MTTTTRSSMCEKTLLVAISEGDQRAFAKLYEWHFNRLSTFVFKMTESKEMTEEIVQDVFFQVWKNRQDLWSINSIDDYLFIACRNRCINAMRKAVKKDSIFVKIDDSFFSNTVADEEYTERDVDILFDQAVAELPQQQKKIYELSKFNRLSYAAIAQTLNISPETVRKHLYLANRSIKDYIAKHLRKSALWTIIMLGSILLTR